MGEAQLWKNKKCENFIKLQEMREKGRKKKDIRG